MFVCTLRVEAQETIAFLGRIPRGRAPKSRPRWWWSYTSGGVEWWQAEKTCFWSVKKIKNDRNFVVPLQFKWARYELMKLPNPFQPTDISRSGGWFDRRISRLGKAFKWKIYYLIGFSAQASTLGVFFFNCSVFPKRNQTFWIVKEFIKGWKKLKNNARFCLFTRIYEFLTNFQK